MISREALREYRERPFDDHRWMKALGSKHLWRELRPLKVRPRFKTDPWLHQLVCFWLGLCYPEFLFLLDMGTGKTWILLNLLQQLLREGRVKRGLVFVPRELNMADWVTGCAQHSDLEPWLVPNGEIDEKWDRLLNPKGDLTVIDYAGFQHACCQKKGKSFIPDENKLTKLRRRYDFIGMDESHKAASNHQSLWFSLLRQMTREARACYAATGTLFGKNMEAVWSQYYLVDRGETFGENLGCFRDTFFIAKPHAFKGVELRFNHDRMPLLRQMIQHRSIRYEDHEVSSLPARVMRRALCSMAGEQQDAYLKMLEKMLNAPDDPKEREAYWIRLRQISGGYLVWEDDTGRHQLNFRQNPKLDELERYLDEAGEQQKVVISYEYHPSGELIAARLKDLGISFEWIYGGVKDQSARKDRFIKSPDVRVFLMNSEAGGTGVDGLQHVGHYLFLYETPSGPSQRQQVIKRVHRPGQERRTYIIDFCCARSVDVGILADVQEGRDLFEAVIDGRAARRSLFDDR